MLRHLKVIAKACPLIDFWSKYRPYLKLPTIHRGAKPAYVHYVAQEIADLKEMSYEQLTEQTFNNACKLFKINKGRMINLYEILLITAAAASELWAYQEHLW